MLLNERNIQLHPLTDTLLNDKNIKLSLLRLDLLHPVISGNKWFKLKYNIRQATTEGKTTILSFGGQWSNHLTALACACKYYSLKSIGIIRGEVNGGITPSLQEMKNNDMQLYFISRKEYAQKNDPNFLQQLKQQFGNDIYIIPEGGKNKAGLQGCEEILSFAGKNDFTHIACSVGSGTTLAGLINTSLPDQEILGFTSVKNTRQLHDDIEQLIKDDHHHWQLISNYSFGGFAKTNTILVDFMNRFYQEFALPLDIVYTGKMMFGLLDMIGKDRFPPGSNILAIHTGGLQGNRSLPAGTLLAEKYLKMKQDNKQYNTGQDQCTPPD